MTTGLRRTGLYGDSDPKTTVSPGLRTGLNAPWAILAHLDQDCHEDRRHVIVTAMDWSVAVTPPPSPSAK